MNWIFVLTTKKGPLKVLLNTVEMRGFEPLSATATLASSTNISHSCYWKSGKWTSQPFSSHFYFLNVNEMTFTFDTLTRFTPIAHHQWEWNYECRIKLRELILELKTLFQQLIVRMFAHRARLKQHVYQLFLLYWQLNFDWCFNSGIKECLQMLMGASRQNDTSPWSVYYRVFREIFQG